jgi:hypothetical protein
MEKLLTKMVGQKSNCFTTTQKAKYLAEKLFWEYTSKNEE